MKDILLVCSIILVGVAAIVKMPGGVGGIFHKVADTHPEQLDHLYETGRNQCRIHHVHDPVPDAGLLHAAVISFRALLTSKSDHTLRKNSILMPLYMIICSCLVIAAYYAVAQIPNLEKQ